MNYAQQMNENVKELLTAHNISIRQLADAVIVPASTLNEALKSKRGLAVDVAIRIADFFGFSVEELSTVSPDEIIALHPQSNLAKDSIGNKLLLSSFASLNEDGQQKVIEFAQLIEHSGKYKKDYSVERSKDVS